MHRRQRPAPEWREEGEMEKIDVEMNDVECLGATRHLVQHHQMVGQRILAIVIEPQRLAAGTAQHPFCPGITAREQCDVMPFTNHLFSQIRNDPLRAAIKLWRAALVQWSYLRNPH